MTREGFEEESGDPVDINVNHMVVAGITRSGKSETVKQIGVTGNPTRWITSLTRYFLSVAFMESAFKAFTGS